MLCLEKAAAAWKDFAPTETFAGKTLAEFEAAIGLSKSVRTKITNIENELKALLITRMDADIAALIIRTLLVNAVVGDPNFGPNSAFYEALGYIRKDARRSGLTRKSHSGLKETI